MHHVCHIFSSSRCCLFPFIMLNRLLYLHNILPAHLTYCTVLERDKFSLKYLYCDSCPQLGGDDCWFVHRADIWLWKEHQTKCMTTCGKGKMCHLYSKIWGEGRYCCQGGSAGGIKMGNIRALMVSLLCFSLDHGGWLGFSTPMTGHWGRRKCAIYTTAMHEGRAVGSFIMCLHCHAITNLCGLCV